MSPVLWQTDIREITVDDSSDIDISFIPKADSKETITDYDRDISSTHPSDGAGLLGTNRSSLKIASLNVCGIKPKLNSPDFSDYVRDYDFILVSETKIDSIDEQIILEKLPDGYTASFKSREYCSKYSSGGIGIIFKQVFSDKVKFLPTENKCVLWCKLDKTIGDFDKDLLLGSIYVPPEKSDFYMPDIMEDLELEIMEKQIQENAYMCLGGDFNARTSVLSDILSDTDDPDLGCPDYFKKDCPVKSTRKNCDKKTNNNGYGLVNLCISTNLFIVNGRTNGDPEGDLTFKGKSAIDYFVCSFDLAGLINRFCVLPFNPLFSDGHSPLSFELSAKLQTCVRKNGNVTENVPQDSDIPQSKKVKWDRAKSSVFKEFLQGDARWNDVHNNISNPLYRSQSDIDNIVGAVSEILLDCAEKCGMVKKCPTVHGKTGSNSKSKTNFKWFNTECKNARSEFETSKRRYHDCKNEDNLKNMKDKSKTYKEVIRKAKQAEEKGFADNLRRLQSNDPKKFWNLINEKGGSSKPHESPSIQEFFTHFAALYDTNPADENVFLPNTLFEEIENSGINEPFTTQEVLKGIRSLKNNKAPGSDFVTNEMLKNVPQNVISIISEVFNLILDTGIVPISWASGLIKPIYKNKGDAKDVDNYRAITLVSCFGKLFTSLLNSRLTDMLEGNRVISEAQAGFRAGHSTIDHIFALKSIVELYLAQGRKLYCAFVDYKKAFDTVSRTILWRKLAAQGINGKIFNVIRNLYENAKSCIVVDGNMSDYFETKIGVKQGENLSPLLFSLFLNDIEAFFLDHSGASLSFIEKLYEKAQPDELLWIKLFIILYADDTVILAENEIDLQQQLDALYEYCRENQLMVNASKTKVMVFARSKARLKNIPDFKYGESVLELVDNYTYLGIVFSWNGKFDKAKCELAKKAERAMFAIIQKGRKLHLEIDLMLKLFDSCVLPILLYGSEVWGYETVDILERVHTKFCKIILRCSKFVHNSVIYAELGRYPIYLEINRRMLNFWSRLLLGSDRKFSSVLYRILLNLNDKERHISPWINHIKSLLQNTGVNFIWLSQQVQNCMYTGTIVNKVQQDQFLQAWCDKIAENPDFTSYRIFKSDIAREKYLSVLPEYLLQPFIEFRTGSYRIPVNNRRLELPRNERKCKYCQMNKLGDEFHFLFQCSTLTGIRNKYIPASYIRNPDIVKMKNLLQNEAYIFEIARFIFESFNLLKDLKENPPTT